MSGKTIRIFLADGEPTGILLAEISNWTGKVLVAPRPQLDQLSKGEGVNLQSSQRGQLWAVIDMKPCSRWSTRSGRDTLRGVDANSTRWPSRLRYPPTYGTHHGA